MDEIFSKRAWCSPVAVASSTGLSIKQDKDSGIIETISGELYIIHVVLVFFYILVEEITKLFILSSYHFHNCHCILILMINI